MKRVALAVLAILIVAAGIVAWRLYGARPGTSAAFSALFPTGPIACPENPNDLAGIEGWAPGAGKAEQMGQTGAGNISGFAGALGGAQPTPAPTATSACKGLNAVVVDRFDTIAQSVKYVPTDGFDPAARADELSDASAIFAYVRDRIHNDAYPGVMRGAAGTLQARAGSSADKALLFGALLAAKQIPFRYVHADLSDAEVASVVATVLAAPASPQPYDLSAAFKDLGIDVAAARAGAQNVRRRAQAGADQTLATARSATDALLATLKSKNVTLAADDAAVRQAFGAALRDHWWVQVQQNGAWIDEDPTLPDAQPGKHLGAEPTTDALDEMPDTVQTTIAVRLVAQRIAAGALQTTTLVEKTMKLADVDAQPIVVTIGDRSGGSAAIAAATSFTPSIGSTDGEQTGDAFNTDGLARVELQIDVQQPGLPMRTYRRTVVDRRMPDGKSVDPSWTPQRTAYALTTIYDLLPLAGDLDQGFAGVREVQGLKMVQGFMAYAAAGGNGRQMPPPASETYPMQALHYFEADQVMRGRLERDGTRFFFDRPQLAMERRGFDFTNARLSSVQAFDVVENGMAATGSQPSAAIRSNFTRGYADEYAEQHLWSAPNDGGTIAVMDQAQKDDVPLVVLSGPQYGGTALAPSKSVNLNGAPRMGWWQVDTAQGNLIGRMGPDGAGQELAEYAIARANDWTTLYAMIQFYGDFFRCIAGAVEAPLSGLSGAAAQHWFEQCAGAAICGYLEALGSGEALSRLEISDLDTLLYNILDLSVPGKPGAPSVKDPWPPAGGAVCSALFKSPLYP
jgi:transglutaminase-like putative cysteine protease